MKQLILLVGAILVGTYCFASMQSSNLSKNSPMLKSLGSAWKAPTSSHPKLEKNDLIMVYGGADVHKPTTAITRTATA